MKVPIVNRAIVPLARVVAPEGDQFKIEALRHGDVMLGPDWADRFPEREALHAWARTQEPTRPAKDDAGVTPWVAMASYERHPLAPYNPGAAGKFHICGRVNAEGELELAAVPEQEEDWREAAACRSYVLAAIELPGGYRAAVHGDVSPALRLASREEAEEVLLTEDGHLRRSAAPRCVGVLMETGRAYYRYTVQATTIVRNEQGEELSREEHAPSSAIRSIEHYGYVWVFYAAVIDGVLYLLDVPACATPEAGTVVLDTAVTRTIAADGQVTTEYTTARVPLPCPPTSDDVRTSGFSGSVYNPDDIYLESATPVFLRAAEQLFGVAGGRVGRAYDATEFTNERLLDDEEGTVVCRRALARVTGSVGEGLAVAPLVHGDVNAGTTFTSHRGGVYTLPGGALQWVAAADLEFEEKDASETPEVPQRGTSLYIPYLSAGPGGWMYAGWLSFDGSRSGRVYTLEAPRQAWGAGVTDGQRDPESLVLTTVTCQMTTVQVVEDPNTPSPPPITPTPEPDPEAEDDFEELETGRLGDFYEYTCDSAVVAPLHMSSTLGDGDLVSLIEASGPEAVPPVRFTFSLNTGSRFFRTPSYQYEITVTLGGSDGPYSWMGEENKFCNVGSVSFDPPRLGIGEYVATLTVAWAAPHAEVAPDRVVTLVKTVPAKNKVAACSLAGATSVSATEKLTAGNLIKVSEVTTRNARHPAKYYTVSWTEVFDEVTTDPDTGHEVRTPRKINYKRHFASRESADALCATLPQNERAEITRGPYMRSMANPAWWVVHVMHVSIDTVALRRTMCWEREFTASMSGELTLAATSGSYHIAASVGEVIKALPS